jgi:hypothetical protein
MSNIRDLEKWEKCMSEFRIFAEAVGGELQIVRLANGKETISCRVWYVPQNPEEHNDNN